MISHTITTTHHTKDTQSKPMMSTTTDPIFSKVLAQQEEQNVNDLVRNTPIAVVQKVPTDGKLMGTSEWFPLVFDHVWVRLNGGDSFVSRAPSQATTWMSP